MKEPITKFDLEAAFKALDEIEMPKAGNVKANRPALNEIFSRKTKFDALMEEYYDVGSMEELGDAKESREAEVAQAKLARIEKIVDLDAESPEDLLPSYVGKFIMQCPQCMTLFYKNPEDVEASEEDPDIVNVQEVCQHCGNESGYTLIGKVGAATEEEMSEYTQEETVDVTSTEEDEEELQLDDEIPTEESEEELDLELDELDLDIEDDDSEKTEESFNVSGGEQTLVEELREEADLDVSADEFEKLISSPEFKKPISDSEARAMMDELGDKKEEVEEAFILTDDEDILADKIEDVMYYGKFLQAKWIKDAPTVKQLDKYNFLVKHHKGSGEVTVSFSPEEPENLVLKFTVNGKPFETKLVREAQEFILKELDAVRRKNFDVSLEACDNSQQNSEPLKEGVLDNLKDKFAGVIDNIADALKSREAKADWLLNNALNDYSNIKVDANGKIEPGANNKKFNTFTVVGYANRNSKGELIKAMPDFDDRLLVVGKNGVVSTSSYKEADTTAKNWSKVSGNGPAFIYLSNGQNDDNAAFLCGYFFGTLENDQLESYFKNTKDSLKNANVNAAVGTEETANAQAPANEGLATLMSGVEDLHETALEKLISDSLVESYGNVAGFRLTECSYENGKFAVGGTIFFTSGNKRKTSYEFYEATAQGGGRIMLRGLNEKLGTDRQFTIIGHTDSNKTFITESFTVVKK